MEWQLKFIMFDLHLPLGLLLPIAGLATFATGSCRLSRYHWFYGCHLCAIGCLGFVWAIVASGLVVVSAINF